MIWILFFLLSWLSAHAESAGGLDLSAAVQEAKSQSPEVRRLEASADAASAKRLEALSGHLPHLSLSGEHYFLAHYSRLGLLFNGNPVNFPSAFPQTTLALDASITVFDGLGTVHLYRAASLGYEAARYDLAHATYHLDHEVRVRFYQALASEALLRVAEQNIRSLEDHLSIARASQRSGLGTRFSVLRIEAQLEEARAEELLAADNVAVVRRHLAQAMGLQEDNRPLVGSLPVPEASWVPSDLKLEAGERQDVKAQTSREASLDEQSAASSAFWFPRISVFGQEQWYKFGSFDPAVIPNATFQNAYSLGVRLSWDLFDGGASIARRQEAAARTREAEQKTRGVLVSIPADFDLWKRRFAYNVNLYQARLRTLEKSQESVRLATLGLKAGSNTHTEVLDAELDLFRARAGIIRAQADATEALLNLELATGVSVHNL
jgi:outer membrane protein TolC